MSVTATTTTTRFVAAKICAQIEGDGDGDSEEICWFFFNKYFFSFWVMHEKSI
jgi:hypothetical protein